MIPGTAVITGPSRSITLPTRIGGPSKNERTLVGRDLQQPFVGRARVLHAIHVVDLPVARDAFLKTSLVDSVLDIVRNGSIGLIEYGGLVHVIPEPRKPLGNQWLV